MSINIAGIDFSVTVPISEHVNSRINRLAKRYPLIKAHITLSKVHDDFTCHVDYKGDHQEATAEATGVDLYKSISLSTERLERQLNDQKEASKKKGKQGIKDLSVDVTDGAYDPELDHY